MIYLKLNVSCNCKMQRSLLLSLYDAGMHNSINVPVSHLFPPQSYKQLPLVLSHGWLIQFTLHGYRQSSPNDNIHSENNCSDIFNVLFTAHVLILFSRVFKLNVYLLFNMYDLVNQHPYLQAQNI